MAQATRSSNRRRSSGAGASSAARAARPAGAVGEAIAAQRAAAAGTKAAGRAAAAAASQAKTPLILGGAAIAGIAGGVAVRSRGRARRPRARSRLGELARPLRDGKLDLESVASAGRRLSEVGQQVADVAAAAQQAREGRQK